MTELQIMDMIGNAIKALSVIIIAYLVRLTLGGPKKPPIKIYLLIFFLMIFAFWLVDKAYAADCSYISTQQESSKQNKLVSGYQVIGRSCFLAHGLRPNSHETQTYRDARQCQKCFKENGQDCPQCKKCYECHKCYICHTQWLSCHQCEHTSSNKKCHYCRCKPCVDQKHAHKEQKKEEQRHRMELQREEEERIRLSAPCQPDPHPYIIIKEQEITEESSFDDVLNFLESRGFDVDGCRFSSSNYDHSRTCWTIADPAKYRGKYLHNKLRLEVKEIIDKLNAQGDAYRDQAIEKLWALPLVSQEEAVTMCISSSLQAFVPGSPPQKIIGALVVALSQYGVHCTREWFEIKELFQKSSDCYTEAENFIKCLRCCN